MKKKKDTSSRSLVERLFFMMILTNILFNYIVCSEVTFENSITTQGDTVMKLVLKTGVILSAIIIMFLGTIFITKNKTEIYHNNRMVYISRITGFLDQTQYLVDLKTGNETIRIHNPIITKLIIVKYDGYCRCVNEIHKGSDYSVFLLSDGRVAYFEGMTDVLKTVPYNQVRDKFEEGKKIRNQLAEKHKDIIAQAKNDS